MPFSTIKKENTADGYSYYYPDFDPVKCVPYVVSQLVSGVETYSCAIGSKYGGTRDVSQGTLSWKEGEKEALLITTFDNQNLRNFGYQRLAYCKKNKNEVVFIKDYDGESYSIISLPLGFYDSQRQSIRYIQEERSDFCPLTIAGEKSVLTAFDTNIFPYVYRTKAEAGAAKPNLPLPSTAKVFADAAVYLWGKEIYLIFVGTGIIFSTTLQDGTFGYLDTTSVMGIISQYGYLDYADDEQYLYMMGQDTTNKIKVAKLMLNTRFDYATDGAWLPLVTGDGVPAYIKAKSDKK